MTTKIPELDETLKTKKKKSTILSENSQKPKSDKATHYVDNEKFFQELLKHLSACNEAEAAGKPIPKASNYIGQCLIMICEHLATKWQFSRYTYKDMLVDRAVEDTLSKLRKFNPQKTQNPFSYFTQIAFYSFLETIKEEQFETYVRYKSIMDSFNFGIHDNGVISEEDHLEIKNQQKENADFQVEHIEEFIKKFEEKYIKGDRAKSRAIKKSLNENPLADIFDTAPEIV